MSEKNFVNYHILISHNASCLNRDDLGMQKTAVFGGTRRVRISSQSLKREMRKPRLEEFNQSYWKKHLGEPSIRTRDLTKLNDKFIQILGEEFENSLIKEAIERFVKSANTIANETEENSLDDENAESEKVDTKKASKKIAVAPWVINEIREICRIIKTVKDEGLTDEELKKIDENLAKQKKNKKSKDELVDDEIGKRIEKQLKGKIDVVEKALASAKDIALFGRMATSGLMTSVDGAMAIAHAITTHTVDGDIDWFTAVDDLIQDSGETGSGHLDTQEFSAGVFYRYASLNLGLLQKNLGVDRAEALTVAGHLLHLLATSVPSAKQNSFAAFNPADFAFVSLSDLPISLANAFEEPVTRGRNGGFRIPSINAFCTYKQRIYDGYSLQDQSSFFSIEDCKLEEKKVKNLAELVQWLQHDGKD